MKTPENLVEAVERLNPQVILLLDTNTIMDNPRLESYEIAAAGPFLLVVPQVVDNELLSLTFNNDPETKRKAERARKHLRNLYERGNAAVGIDVGNDRWVITARAPRPAGHENTPIEEDQIRRYLGQVDAALLRLADACAEDLPDTRAVLVTKDKNLTHVARSRGLAVFSLPKLRSREALDKLLPDSHSGGDLDLDTHFSSLLDSNEERSVKIALTLEELESKGELLIARGTGSLTYDGRHPFRWIFPYKNANNDSLESLWEMLLTNAMGVVLHSAPVPNALSLLTEYAGGMPLENVDFFDMGVKESIPEEVIRIVCDFLEDAAYGGDVRRVGTCSLQSPSVRARLVFAHIVAMEWYHYGYNGVSVITHSLDKSSEELESINDLYDNYYRCCRSLLNGTAESFPEAYFMASEANRALDEAVGNEPLGAPERDLGRLLDAALDTWHLGETQENEYTFYPWPQDKQESDVDEDDEDDVEMEDQEGDGMFED